MKEIRAAPLFVKDYERASPGLAERARREIADLGVRMASRPIDWMRTYQTVHGLGRNDVREGDLAGGPRFYFHSGSDAVTLLRMSADHDLTQRITRTEIDLQIENAVELPPDFRRDQFPPSSRGSATVPSYVEAHPEWAFFLNVQQHLVATDLIADIERDLLEVDSSCHFVLGGPGTGKTVILLWLLQRLGSVDPNSRETWDVRLRASPQVIDQLARSTGWDLGGIAVTHDEPFDRADVTLVDDPVDLATVAAALDLARRERSAVVVGMDPRQMRNNLPAHSYFDLVRDHAVQQKRLQECFRQKATVGATAAEIDLAFPDPESALPVDITASTFPVAGGLVLRRVDAGDDDWAEVVEHLSRLRPHMWEHWPSVLLAIDPQQPVSERWIDELRSAIGDHNIEQVSLDDVDLVRGVEYEHAVLVIAPQTNARVAQGLARPDAASRNLHRLLRIPFSRPRDSMIVVVPEPGVR